MQNSEIALIQEPCTILIQFLSREWTIWKYRF